ncbi:MAG: hypothetical protein J7K79_06030 [Thermotoga sp.]|nr:hypothetical protein [Thermotoga sp.]
MILETLFALLIVTTAFLMVCGVAVQARRRFVLYKEREIAKRTAEGIFMRIEVNQPVPETYNDFEVSVRDGFICLKKSGREYRFEVNRWYSGPQ